MYSRVSVLGTIHGCRIPFWYIWDWELPNVAIKNGQMGHEWVLLFFSFQTNELFENWTDTCLFFIKAKTWICWCIHVKSRWIKLYTKIWHQIRHNNLRHESLWEDWYLDPAAVSLYQGQGCHTVNNTWRRWSLHRWNVSMERSGLMKYGMQGSRDAAISSNQKNNNNNNLPHIK